MRHIVIMICCCMAVAPASARMYQWRNPATGTTQMSGAPPAWYRSGDPGPRVYVFENNQLVDDTGIAVSDTQRDALRDAAFGAAEKSRLEPETRPAAEAAPREARSEAGSPPPAATDSVAADAPPKPAADTASADKAAALKALIDAWDQHQLDQARSLLEMMPAEGKGAPAHP